MLRPHQRSAFTLIEILVVVAIITLLIAIAVPALSKAKSYAKASATRAQLQHISQICEIYFSEFNAYPGPLADQTVAGPTVAFSGAQNLYLGLTRRFYPTANYVAPGVTTVTPLNTTISFDIDPGKQLANYAVNNPYGALTQTLDGLPANTFPPFLAAKPEEVSTSKYGSVDTINLPCFVDSAFGSDKMPILYYRLNYKWDAEIYNSGKTAGTPYATVQTSDLNTDQACYYAGTNSKLGGPAAASLISFVTKNPTNTTDQTKWIPAGGFVLISAGVDRQYGTSDDIVVVGGQ